jgi:NADH dehydrogenase [ubiquinone] 1 alpha subcomplex assembly factor 6
MMMHSKLFKRSWSCKSLNYFSTTAYHGKSSNSYDSNKYCVDLVRKWDYDNYLVGLLFPAKFRDSFFAVRAFNVEIALLKDQLSRNAFHTGKIRFQFWRDMLNNIYGASGILQQHPAANALERAIKNNNLTLRWFERSLDARYVHFLSFTNTNDS